MRVRYFEDKAVDPPRKMKEIREFRELFYKFLTNDWVHTERKISALDAQMKLVLAMLSVLVGLMVYMVIE
jgi:hypothetical protein|tara:strand:+ start:1774 stop:1983 length:210 start_codon:yes stop_codon:yes gene_type:complete